MDFNAPCDECRAGNHNTGCSPMCGCLAPHASDDALMTGFKRLKRDLHPERARLVAGGWPEETIEVPEDMARASKKVRSIQN